MDKKYVDLGNTSSQYDDIDFVKGSFVDARYVRAINEKDRGNIFIEALPFFRSDSEIERDYNNVLLSFDARKATTEIDKYYLIESIKEVRYGLPFHKELELSFHTVMVEAYRSKYLMLGNNQKISLQMQNKSCDSAGILFGDSADGTKAGFSLIGYSGCGKSTSIKTLTSHYPQVIIHHLDNNETMPQITYLVVNCIPNSNFSALYEGIGDAIDKAVGNVIPVYSEIIRKARNLGSKANKVKELLEQFAVGVIIFDEIQLIDFQNTNENSFESLMILANRTKTAIGVVGTEDAKEVMFGKLRTSRRLGSYINGNLYCHSKEFFHTIASDLFQYQVFEKPVPYSDEIGDYLYKVTKGIVDQLISVFCAVQKEYILAEGDAKPKVNLNFFEAVYKKYFRNMQTILANFENVENAKMYKEMHTDIDKQLDEKATLMMQRKEMLKMMENRKGKGNIIQTMKNIAILIKDSYSFSDKEITEAFNKVSALFDIDKLSEKEIAEKVIDEINKKHEAKKKTKAKVDTSQYISMLDEHVYKVK